LKTTIHHIYWTVVRPYDIRVQDIDGSRENLGASPLIMQYS
jgi:hypothetical protein